METKERREVKTLGEEIAEMREEYPQGTFCGLNDDGSQHVVEGGIYTHCPECGQRVLVDEGYVNGYGEFIPTIADCKCGCRINGDLNGVWE